MFAICLSGLWSDTGRLDAEMDTATRRMAGVLKKLPREITPVNLEELRRVKQALVEVESKADQLRHATSLFRKILKQQSWKHDHHTANSQSKNSLSSPYNLLAGLIFVLESEMNEIPTILPWCDNHDLDNVEHSCMGLEIIEGKIYQ